jgi:periplasmic divalent cation tolerance protein
MDEALVVYCPFPDMTSAEAAGRRLVDARLAACVNILPGMRSIYRWRGDIDTADEVVIILKSRMGLRDPLVAELARLHPHEMPAILAWPAPAAGAATLGWITSETTTGER